jgi:hypothetical protein
LKIEQIDVYSLKDMDSYLTRETCDFFSQAVAVCLDNQNHSPITGEKKMKKSEQVNELHEKSMEIAQAAFVARMQGELENVKKLSYQAFEYERKAWTTRQSTTGNFRRIKGVIY